MVGQEFVQPQVMRGGQTPAQLPSCHLEGFLRAAGVQGLPWGFLLRGWGSMPSPCISPSGLDTSGSQQPSEDLGGP